MPPVRPARRVLIFVAVILGLWLPPLLTLRAADTARAFSSIPLVDFRFSARPGVNLHPSELTAARLPETLARLDVLGIRWVRFTVSWDAVEPQRGRFNWEAWDAVMAALAERPDLQPVVVLDRSPSWARGEADADNPRAPPLERAYFGAFARALAERYGQQLRYYQVWHEPNIAPHWGAQAANPAAYVGLLREAALHIRGADAEAQVVLAALAPTVEAGGANLSDIAYLDGIYAAKGEPWFDVVAAQPYGFFAPPSEPATPETLNFARVTLLRDVLVRRGDAAKPLWASNWGWKAGSSAGSSWAGVDSAEQREFATQAFSTAQRQWPWLGPLFWPALCPDLPEDDPLLGFALCEGEGPTPAGEAIAAAAQSPEVLPPGHHRLDHPAFVYGEGWRLSGGAADPPQTEIAAASGAGAAAPRAGPPLSFKFYGTGVALHIQGGEYWAYLTVTVDGRPANALPRNEEGAGYLVLHDPAAARRIVPLASGLPLGEHTVTLTPVGGWGQWPLQGVMVGDAAASPLPGPGLLAIFAALGTVVVALLVLSPRAAYYVRPFRRGIGAFALRLTAFLDRAANLPMALLWFVTALVAIACFFSRWAALDLVLLALLGLLFVIAPPLAVPLIAAALPFWQQPKPLLGLEFGLFEIFAWVGLVAYGTRWLLARFARRSIHPSPRSSVLDWAVLALFAAGTLSTVTAGEQGVAWREWRIVFLFGLVVYGLVRGIPMLAGDAAPLSHSRWLRGIVAGLLTGSVIVSLIALYQLVTGNGRVDVEGVMRVRALYGSPNNLALVLDRAAPLALALALFGPRRRRLIYGAALAVILVVCLATFSKGALLLGLPAGLLVVLVGGAGRIRRRWPLGLLVIAALLALAGLVLLFRTPRFADLFNFEAGTSFFRIKLWQGALNMALDHPLLGVGPDNFLYAYRTRYVLPSAWQELNLSHPHNILLDLWTRIGFLGTAFGLWALVAGITAAWRRFRNAPADLWPIALGLLATLVVTVAHGLIDNSLFLPDLMGWFALALGLVASAELWQDVSVLGERQPQE